LEKGGMRLHDEPQVLLGGATVNQLVQPMADLPQLQNLDRPIDRSILDRKM